MDGECSCYFILMENVLLYTDRPPLWPSGQSVRLESVRSQVRIPLAPRFFRGHTSDVKIDTPVAILPGAWRYKVSAGTDRPGVSIL